MKTPSTQPIMSPRLLALAVILGAILTSCNYRTHQKGFITSSPHVADFSTQSRSNLKVLPGFSDSEIQFTTTIGPNEGLAISALSSYTGHYYLETGWVWFKKEGNSYFEINSGLGFGYVNSDLDGVPNDFISLLSLPNNIYYSHNIEALYMRAFVQPSYIVRNSLRERFAFTFKLAPVFFLNYDYDHRLDSYGGSGIGGLLGNDNIQFRNKMGVTIEPVITMKFPSQKHDNRFFIIQTGGSYTFAAARSRTTQNITPPDRRYVKLFEHPRQNGVIFNVGLEFDF